MVKSQVLTLYGKRNFYKHGNTHVFGSYFITSVKFRKYTEYYLTSIYSTLTSKYKMGIFFHFNLIAIQVSLLEMKKLVPLIPYY